MKRGESVDVSREQDSLYGNEIEANKEANSGACTNTMNIDINSEPGPGRADRIVDSQNQADSATEIHKLNSESKKVVQNNSFNISTGLVGHDIGFLTAECHSQSYIEKYVTRSHIDFPMTLPKGVNNQTFPVGILNF